MSSSRSSIPVATREAVEVERVHIRITSAPRAQVGANGGRPEYSSATGVLQNEGGATLRSGCHQVCAFRATGHITGLVDAYKRALCVGRTCEHEDGENCRRSRERTVYMARPRALDSWCHRARSVIKALDKLDEYSSHWLKTVKRGSAVVTDRVLTPLNATALQTYVKGTACERRS